MPPPLHGIRVVDTTTGPVGGIATMVLADLGADVVKVEPPGGDRFRNAAASPLWLRGKRSVVADLHAEQGRAVLQDLVRAADVLVVAGPPERAARWGVDAVACAALRPSLVHCAITGWGAAGPLSDIPAYVSTVAARAGRMVAFSGQVRRDGPVYAALPVAGHAASHGAVHGIISALIARAHIDGVQRVETSLLQGLMPFDLVELLLVQLAERGIAPPVPAEMPTLNYHPVLAADGVWIQCGNLLEHLFLSFLDAIGLYGELLADEHGRFLESPALWTPEAVDVARDAILVRMQEKPAAEWMSIFHADGNVAAEPFATPAMAMDHPDLVDNGSIVELLDPIHGPVRMVGPMAALSATPVAISRPAPLPGAHTQEVTAEWAGAGGATPEPPRRRGSAGAPGPVRGRPLDGVVVVEFAAVIAAPLAASMLADQGARVIRVEPLEGDSYRHLLPNGSMAVKTTANKESIAIDLKRPEGRAIARSLVAKADVLIHNYRLGVPERLGIGYEDLHAEFPGLVWVAVSGYGPDGPSRRRPATHPVAGAAMGGAGYQAGSAVVRPCPTLAEVRETARQLMKANESNPDPNTSVVIASATLAALFHRNRTGEGQAVRVDMMTANADANADVFLSYAGMASRPVIDAGHHGTGPWHRLYRARTGWVFLAVTTAQERMRFDDLTGFTGRPDGELDALFAQRDAADWEALLAHAGVACVVAAESTPGPFFLRHPQMLANGFAPVADHARFGDIRRWGPLVTVDGGGGGYGTGVLAGEHTDALLAELGHDPDAIAQMRSAGVVGSEPVVLPYVG